MQSSTSSASSSRAPACCRNGANQPPWTRAPLARSHTMLGGQHRQLLHGAQISREMQTILHSLLMFAAVYRLTYWLCRLVLGCSWKSMVAGIRAFRGRARHHSQKCCLLDARKWSSLPRATLYLKSKNWKSVSFLVSKML